MPLQRCYPGNHGCKIEERNTTVDLCMRDLKIEMDPVVPMIQNTAVQLMIIVWKVEALPPCPALLSFIHEQQ